MPVAKEQIRQVISENDVQHYHVYALLQNSYKDILQELIKADLDDTLGYEKNRKGNFQTDNKRNGHSPKNFKSQYREIQIDVSRNRNGEYEPNLIPKYQRDISGTVKKVISLYNSFILYNKKVERSVTPVIKIITSVTDLLNVYHFEFFFLNISIFCSF